MPVMKSNLVNTVLESGKAWKYLIYLLIIAIFTHGLISKRYTSGGFTKWDAANYYAYLPAIFIYKDLSLRYIEDLPENIKGTIWLFPTDKGRYTLKYPTGTAVMILPFFLLSHIFAHLTGIEASGYSWPYHFFLLTAAIFYLLAGLLYLRKTLLRYFSESTVMICLVILAIGTNIFYYATEEPGMSHIYSFFLFSAFIFHINSFYRRETWIDPLVIGLVSGLIVIVRPSNSILLLCFLLYRGNLGIIDWLNYLWNMRIRLLVMFTIGLVILFIQLSYWKYCTGNWIYYSYGEERFYFLKPHIIEGLFSYRTGWLVYTPLMSLAVSGFLFLKKKAPELFYPILVFSVLNIYIVFSWWCWWYGGSFGARSLIESYALLSIPLAATVERLWNSGAVTRIISAVILIFFIHLNFFQSRQYRISLLHYEETSKELYWAVFLSNERPKNYEELLDPIDIEKALKGE
jgi:hypothetical protein